MLRGRLKLALFPFLLLSLVHCAQPQETAKIAGPLVVSSNPHYFKDANGTALILAGSQTWNTLQDWGSGGSAQALDFPAFVKFLSAHGQNFTLLWRVEMPKFCSLPSTSSAPPDFTVSPQPWQRTGPGNATDGGLKFDLTKFDQGYFDRLRARTQALNDAGIYAGYLPLYRGVHQHLPLRQRWLSFYRREQHQWHRRRLHQRPQRHGVHDHDGAQRHHPLSGRLCRESDRHPERFAERAVDRFRRSSEQYGLV